MATIDVIGPDKTGTVTEGEFGVVAQVASSAADVFALAAAVERYSEHPIGRAVVRYVECRAGTLPLEVHATSLAACCASIAIVAPRARAS
jgi:P-type Cu2+ transporter